MINVKVNKVNYLNNNKKELKKLHFSSWSSFGNLLYRILTTRWQCTNMFCNDRRLELKLGGETT